MSGSGTPADLRIRAAALRRAIGWIGVGLPFVLPVGKVVFFSAGLPGSISAYYYTDMRNVLVAAVCAVGVYLLYYPGYDRVDNLTASLAGAASIVVGLCPTSPPDPSTTQSVVGTIHLVAAATFFFSLAYFSFFRFTRSSSAPTARKELRNRWYRACGIVIAVCTVATVPADNLLPRSTVDALHPVFWLESVAELAFGVSWLIKGETFLTDFPAGGDLGHPAPGRRVTGEESGYAGS